jgi:hypothetical protein
MNVNVDISFFNNIIPPVRHEFVHRVDFIQMMAEGAVNNDSFFVLENI